LTVTIPRRERDPALQGKLLAELPGVLAWIVAGARLYIEEGLDPPDTVETATKTYRDEEDVVGRFIADRCDVGGTYWTAASDLYQAWKDWCITNGEDPGTQTAFGTRLSEVRDDLGEQGFPPDRVGGTRVRMARTPGLPGASLGRSRAWAGVRGRRVTLATGHRRRLGH
jgi:phage/plasmid-associated DNA primase